jgi:hypothetical protein
MNWPEAPKMELPMHLCTNTRAACRQDMYAGVGICVWVILISKSEEKILITKSGRRLLISNAWGCNRFGGQRTNKVEAVNLLCYAVLLYGCTCCLSNVSRLISELQPSSSVVLLFGDFGCSFVLQCAVCETVRLYHRYHSSRRISWDLPKLEIMSQWRKILPKIGSYAPMNFLNAFGSCEYTNTRTHFQTEVICSVVKEHSKGTHSKSANVVTRR